MKTMKVKHPHEIPENYTGIVEFEHGYIYIILMILNFIEKAGQRLFGMMDIKNGG